MVEIILINYILAYKFWWGNKYISSYSIVLDIRLMNIFKPTFKVIDRLLSVPESKVSYLTKITPIDRFLNATLLKVFPESITPNRITRFRLFSVPIIGVAHFLNYVEFATLLFLLAAFSDALDGAMARTQNKVTNWGTVYDPIADKLLIGTVSLIVVSKHNFYLALTIILLEIFLMASAYFRYTGKVVPAKMMGKMKMVLECVGVGLLLLSVTLSLPFLELIGTYTLYGAVVFALLSLFVFRSV
jgi:CDP-diacylglycerol--glycerol-3-phosphate 3-phosphatidyltransferase